MITARFGHRGHDYDLTNWVRFVSQAEKVESKWKLLTLEVIYIRDGIAPVGNAPTPEFWQLNGWPRKSYRFLAWHLGARGVKVREDLPGTDDEESVNEVMDRNRGWINAE